MGEIQYNAYKADSPGLSKIKTEFANYYNALVQTSSEPELITPRILHLYPNDVMVVARSLDEITREPKDFVGIAKLTNYAGGPDISAVLDPDNEKSVYLPAENSDPDDDTPDLAEFGYEKLKEQTGFDLYKGGKVAVLTHIESFQKQKGIATGLIEFAKKLDGGYELIMVAAHSEDSADALYKFGEANDLLYAKTSFIPTELTDDDGSVIRVWHSSFDTG